jgi:hypothetical protein
VYNLFQTGAGVILKERAHQSTIEFDWILSYLGDYQCPYEPLFISIRRSAAAWACLYVRDAARSTANDIKRIKQSNIKLSGKRA